MTSPMIDTAVIGVGLIGEQHARWYADDPRTRLQIVCDLDPERARGVGERFSCASTASIADVAASDAAIVSVATPDFAHFEPVMAMLQAGKHVVVEKPLATTTAEARKMVAFARAQGCKLTINLGNRWYGTFQNVRDSVQSGEIGEPIMAYSRTSDTIWVPRTMLPWAGRSGPQ